MSQAAPLVDTHAHIFVPGLPLVDGATNRPGYSCTDTDYLAALDAAGIRYGVIAAPSFLGTHIDYTLECLRRQPRLRATAIVDADVPLQRLKELDRQGIVGIRYTLRNYRDVPDFRALEYRRLLAAVAELDWHVHILAESDRLATMVPLLAESGAKLLIDHFGVPSGPECPGQRAILGALETGRTWIRLSAPYRLSDGVLANELAQLFLREAGPDRLLWGSDWPWVAHEGQYSIAAAIRDFHEWIPDPQARARIDANALAFYRFKER
jgi:predicted TIM-barrel fold metal-dependent hydrolase